VTNNEDVSVLAPQKWMKGWDGIYRKMLEASDEELANIEVGHIPQQLARAIHVAGLKPEGMDTLELACGDGSVACYFGRMGCRVTGIEALSSAIDVASRRRRALSLEANVSFQLEDIRTFPMESGRYDIIIALQCLQYLFDNAIPRLLDIAAAIKPGGFVAYSGNILPHFPTDPPMHFITREDLLRVLDGWTFHSLGTDEILNKPDDLRGYIWTVARKPLD
jgi:2-polyprenyl-3-methyl-5-hydroxy-6-metoxy-1,4-benzoquinol methylase